ncbi:MAG: VOC family protein [Sciscionella sp.]
MSRAVHFEIHASAPQRAIAFYQTVFGWKFEQWEDRAYWLIATGEGPGIDGGLVPRQGPEPEMDEPLAAFPVTMSVADIDEMLAKVVIADGIVVVGKNAVPGVGWLAYCKDTEGNVFGLMQTDPDAS